MDDNKVLKRQTNPKEKSNLFSQLTFLYTGRLFIRGYKKDLEDTDLYKVVKSCESKKLTDKLERVQHATSSKGKLSLSKMLWSCHGFAYAVLGMTGLFTSLLGSTLEPDAISQLVAYFKPGQTKMTIQNALYYAAVLLGLKMLNTLYLPNYMLYLMEMALKIRISISSLIYRKALRLSPKALEKTSVGNIVTIISKDVNEFENSVLLFNDIWIGIIQIIYVCYLIYAKIGMVSAAGVVTLAAVVPLQLFISKVIKNLRLKMNMKTDIRLQETQESLSAIKIIKMYTWEKIFADRINHTRISEMKTKLKKCIMRSSLLVSSELLGKIGFYVMVMLYIYLTATVDAETIFYVMKSFETMRMQITFSFTFGFTMIAELAASISRIENLLNLEELPKHIDKPDDQPQIDIRNVTITFKEREILKDISIKFCAGLNVVTGSLGSGKTSLIKLILRDLPSDSGDLRTRGLMSYASQDSWLFPASIKQNILFGEKYDYERYNKVIEVCALSYDLSVLEKGDETIVQDRGMNLSKGQQARVNLARAIYKKSDIYLIDDALTALDPKVQDHIFTECIQRFLKDKLVLLVTHNPKHISKADNVAILKDGSVKYVGNQPDISEELLRAIEDQVEGDKKVEGEDAVEDEEANEETKLLEESSSKKQIYHENKKAGGIAFEVYKRYVKHGGGIMMILLIIALYVTGTFSDSASQVKLTDWINYETEYTAKKDQNFGNVTVDIEKLRSIYFPKDDINNTHAGALMHPMERPLSSLQIPIPKPVQIAGLPKGKFNINKIYEPVDLLHMSPDQNKTYSALVELAEIETKATQSLNLYTVLIVASVVIQFVREYSLFRFGVNTSINLHRSMVRSVIYSKMSFFDRFFVGNILNRFSQDLYIVDELLPMFLGLTIFAGFSCIGIVGMMAHVNWAFLLPSCGVLVILVASRFIYMPTARSLKRLEAATRSPIIGHLNSSMEGLTTVRAYKAEEILMNEFDRHQDLYTSAKYTSICTSSAFSFYMNFLSTTLFVYVIFRFLFIDVHTPAGDVGLTLSQIGGLTMLLQFGLSQWTETENAMTSVERVMEYTNIEAESSDGSELPEWPSKGEIIYNNVSLKYTNANEYVLSNVSFKVRPKEKIGIVGRTGAGKSTIISTLYRLYDHEGAITIDGVDTKTLSLKHLRQHISIIPQDPILFSGTLRSNLDPLMEFTDEDIWRVLHKVHLGEKVNNLETQIESNNFSSGERQLLSLGRAILRKNKIVVLDEASANMDPETEQMVQKAVDDNFASCTVLIIAHRIECILDCNKVMVLDKGRIAEYDEPAVLLKDSGSAFSKMMMITSGVTHAKDE